MQVRIESPFIITGFTDNQNSALLLEFNDIIEVCRVANTPQDAYTMLENSKIGFLNFAYGTGSTHIWVKQRDVSTQRIISDRILIASNEF